MLGPKHHHSMQWAVLAPWASTLKEAGSAGSCTTGPCTNAARDGWRYLHGLTQVATAHQSLQKGPVHLSSRAKPRALP